MQSVANLKELANKKQIKPYIGNINYFRDYCGMDFADLTAPITVFNKTDVVFHSSEECQKSFDTIKERILQRQKLSIFALMLQIWAVERCFLRRLMV